MKKRLRIFCALLLFSLTLSLFGAAPTTAGAVSYRGSGTMKDPYLVENAEQLQSMRENLTAHYKLANNIDLSGKDFKPIGRLNGPFQGSFICERNSDNTPKYAIRNLSITVNATKYATENTNKWEAALFGCTNGAVISGIYLFDVHIVNNNVGENRGAVVYGNYNPGMDEMACASLVAFAKATTITYCGSTGTVEGKANWTAGLIGLLEDGSIVEYSFSTAKVHSTGKWSVAGFVGGTRGSATVNYCYYNGSATGGTYGTASFTGNCTGATYTYCASSGTTDNGFARTSGVDASSGTFKSCVTNSVSNKSTSADSGAVTGLDECKKVTVTDCCYDSTNGTWQKGFAAADSATVNKKIEAIKAKIAWNVKVSDYTAAAPTVSAPAASTESNASATVSDSGSKVEDSISLQALAEKINALPDPGDKDEFNIDCKADVIEAWKMYSALSVGQQDELDAALVSKLTSAHYQMSLYMASDVVSRMKALKEDEALTADRVKEINALYEDYTFLDDAVKSEISKDLVKKLEAAHEKALKAEDMQTTVTADSALTTWELAIVIFSGVVILLAVAFDVFAGIWLIKRRKTSAADDVFSQSPEDI